MKRTLGNKDLSIDMRDLKFFILGKRNNRINHIWDNFLSSLPNKMAEEAKKKGFKLIKNKYVEEDNKAKYLLVDIQGASKELQAMKEKMVPYIVCFKQPRI